MIKVITSKKNAIYQKIVITGHAMYDEFGKDIVCSAASSITTTTINGILALDKGSLSYKVNDKGVEIIVKKEDKATQTLLENMISLLKELEENYPKNIKVK